MSRTALVGLGAMGGPTASNAVRKLPPIAAYDLVPAALARVGEAGAGFGPASSGRV